MAAGFASVELYVENLLERDVEWIAIQEGLDAAEDGLVCDFDESDREFRERNGIVRDACGGQAN